MISAAAQLSAEAKELEAQKLAAEKEAGEASVMTQSIKDSMSKITYRDTQLYETIFNQHDEHSIGSIDLACVRAYLSDIGLRGRNQMERVAMNKIMEEIDTLEVNFKTLVQHIIPKVRVELAQLRRPHLLDLFKQADEDGSGDLSISEFLVVLDRSGIQPSLKLTTDTVVEVLPNDASEMRNANGQLLLEKNIINRYNFSILAPTLHERFECSRNQHKKALFEQLAFDADARELWQDGVVNAQAAFAHIAGHDTVVNTSQLGKILIHVDLIPKSGNILELLRTLADEEWADAQKKTEERKPIFEEQVAKPLPPKNQKEQPKIVEKTLDLSQCFRVLTKIREKEVQRLADFFSKHDKDSSQGLGIDEVLRCMEDVGIKPRPHKLQEDSAQLRELVEEYDEDGSGELELAEFLNMVKFVTGRLRRSRRREQKDHGKKLGFGRQERDELGDHFLEADNDLDNLLNDHQVAEVVSKMRPEWPRGDTTAILKEMKLMTWLQPASVDMLQLMDVMKFIDVRTRHRKVGEHLGLDQESTDQFCALWLSMKPGDGDTVPFSYFMQAMKKLNLHNKKAVRIQEVLGDGVDGSLRIHFHQFLMVMRREGNSTESAVPQPVTAKPMQKNLGNLLASSALAQHEAATPKSSGTGAPE